MPSLTIPDGYDIEERRDGFAVIELRAGGFGRSLLERGFSCEAEAIFWAQDRAEAIAEEEREAAENAAEFAADDLRWAA